MSRATNLHYTDTLVALDCGECHVPFAIPSNLHHWAKKDGRFFYCPNGHRIHYYETENAELKKKLERAEADKEWLLQRRNAAQREAEYQRRRVAAYKGHVTKIKKRIANGVCPCCNRTFQNVAKHMKTQHPDFDPVAEAEKKVAAVSAD